MGKQKHEPIKLFPFEILKEYCVIVSQEVSGLDCRGSNLELLARRMVNTGHSVRVTHIYHSLKIQRRKFTDYKCETYRSTIICRNI
jgi:hypothetical protein